MTWGEGSDKHSLEKRRKQVQPGEKEALSEQFEAGRMGCITIGQSEQPKDEQRRVGFEEDPGL